MVSTLPNIYIFKDQLFIIFILLFFYPSIHSFINSANSFFERQNLTNWGKHQRTNTREIGHVIWEVGMERECCVKLGCSGRVFLISTLLRDVTVGSALL